MISFEAKRFAPDPILFIGSVVLVSLGLSSIASIAPDLFGSQLLFAVVGVVAFFLFATLDYRLLLLFARQIYILALIALGLTILFGIASHGAVRWFTVGPLRLQFSEILRPFLLVSFSAYILGIKDDRRKILGALVWQFPVLFLIFRQPDLGSAIVYFAAFSVMLLVSGISRRWLVSGVLAVGAFLPIFWELLADYQRNRITTFLNPAADVLGSSYNAVQAIITVGSGMLFGKGLGRGTQTHLFFLPERHTDFIFASFAEEFGFIGSVFLLSAYFLIIWRLIIILRKTSAPAGKLIVAGTITLFLVQGFINIGMNVGLVPVTGVTLPLVSYGGSSLLASLVTLGIVSSISKGERVLF